MINLKRYVFDGWFLSLIPVIASLKLLLGIVFLLENNIEMSICSFFLAAILVFVYRYINGV